MFTSDPGGLSSASAAKTLAGYQHYRPTVQGRLGCPRIRAELERASLYDLMRPFFSGLIDLTFA